MNKFWIISLSTICLCCWCLTGCGEEDKTTVIPVEITNPTIIANLDGAITVTKIVQEVDVKLKFSSDLSVLVSDYGIWRDRTKNNEREAEFRERNNTPEEEEVIFKDRWLFWTFLGILRNNTNEKYTPTEWYATIEGHKLGVTFATIPKAILPGGEMPFFLRTDSLLIDLLDEEYRFEVYLAAPPIQ